MECYKQGFTVVALVLNASSDGSKVLESLNDASQRMVVIAFDLRREETIMNCLQLVTKLINDRLLKFHALINNAGMMIFGELEWLTPGMIRDQIEVNLMGPILMVNHFCQLIRQHQARLVNVTSHCSLKSLPGLSVYSATKAGLRFWTEAVEKELRKFKVHVINFIPGSFIMSSNIAGRTNYWAKLMKAKMNLEQREVYEIYFDRYFAHLSFIPQDVSPVKVQFDKQLLGKMMKAITDFEPELIYKVEPLRYKIYYTLFKFLPTGLLENYLMKRFLQMPQYDEKESL